MKKIGYIYKIVNPKGNIYIGKTTRLKERIANYKYCTGISEQKMIYNSIKKYGWENHIFEIIDQTTENNLSKLEIDYIDRYATYHYDNKNGMNLTKGGEGSSGRVDSPEVRKKRADKIRGRKHTDQTKRLLSDLKKGKPSHRKGVPCSEQTRQKISQANRGKIKSQDTLQKIKNTRLINLINKHEAILQIDINTGEIIKEWVMLPKDIGRYFTTADSNISKCLRKKVPNAHKFIWRYKK